jgi:methionine sulfoxide reductase heme-binding subunit
MDLNMIGTNYLQKWHLVGLMALFVGVMVITIVLLYGVNESGMRMMIRLTGRTSSILFLSAFVASSLRKLWSSSLSAWLIKNRRFLGISMAVSHTYHAFALLGLWYVTAGAAPAFDPLGTIGYILLIAMTITSFEKPAAYLGKRNWQILHTTGMHFLWLGLVAEYTLKLTKSQFIALLFLTFVVLAMILRIVAARKNQLATYI